MALRDGQAPYVQVFIAIPRHAVLTSYRVPFHEHHLQYTMQMQGQRLDIRLWNMTNEVSRIDVTAKSASWSNNRNTFLINSSVI